MYMWDLVGSLNAGICSCSPVVKEVMVQLNSLLSFWRYNKIKLDADDNIIWSVTWKKPWGQVEKEKNKRKNEREQTWNRYCYHRWGPLSCILVILDIETKEAISGVVISRLGLRGYQVITRSKWWPIWVSYHHNMLQMLIDYWYLRWQYFKWTNCVSVPRGNN